MLHPPHDHGLCSMAAPFCESTVQGKNSIWIGDQRKAICGRFLPAPTWSDSVAVLYLRKKETCMKRLIEIRPVESTVFR